MSMAVLLDAGPLGLATNPNVSPEALACRAWLAGLLAAGITVFIPEITDYELRRELLRARKAKGLTRLDGLKTDLYYLPLNTATMLTAAALWARARNEGYPTAAEAALDVDVILAAQALGLKGHGFEPVVATTNPRHLSRFVAARHWSEIVI
ncbi:MAG: PIN domain-containing protein [Planctomycetota bacterium]